jgi:hypothetical protein
MSPRTRVTLALLALIGGGIFVVASCGGQGFEPESVIDGVRILAARADKPFAAPGDTVTLSVLAVDGRAIKPEPMQVAWFPLVCIDPPGDDYYACFAGLLATDAGAVDAGGGLQAPDGGAFGAGMLTPGVNLSPLLAQGTSFSLTLPPDIITKHVTTPGQAPYGIAIAFNIACAGHVELLPPQPGNLDPVQIPVGCFDANENLLGPSDYVVGFTRVYAYAPDSGITATNPTIASLELNDASISVTEADAGPSAALLDGGSVPHCTATKNQNCPGYSLNTTVPLSSWQVDETDIGQSGAPEHVEIWVDYYVTLGTVDDDAMLLFDPLQGQISGTSTTYRAPQAPATAQIWAVVHNNLGGADWAGLAVTAQ